jgi:predicted N-acetyltransferase YhbS
LAVLPELQKQGIGEKLITEGLRKAKELGFSSVIVVGHKDYYPKYGFEKASKWNIKCSFKVPDEAFMAIELNIGALTEKSGIVEFPKEFEIQ